MSTWLSLVVGVILGLLFGWGIELFYRRRPRPSSEAPDEAPVEAAVEPVDWRAVSERVAAVPVEVVAPVAEVHEVAAEVHEIAAEVPDAVEAEVHEVAAELPDVAVRLPEVAAELPEAVVEPPYVPSRLPEEAVEALAPTAAALVDDLTLIEGIGPVYNRRLQAGGIPTFAALAVADPRRLAEIIQPQSWQRLNYEDWIEQARLIVAGDEEALRELQARLFSKKKS